MAKVKTVTKKLGANDPNPYFPEDTGVNYKIYAYKNGSEIHDASKDDYLIGGNGDDVLVTGLGNDTVSGGKGDNTFIMHGGISGNDTVVLGKGTDHLIFAISDNFQYSKTGNDLIINHNSETTEGGKITVKNYFKSKEGAASLKDLYGAGFENPEDLNTLINDAGLTLNGITEKTKKIAGTYLSDVIDAKGDVKNTITTGKGDDIVDAGKGNDTITIDGAGDKTVKIKKGDGNDTIVFKGEGLKANVTLAFDYDQDNPDFADYSYRKEGNNLCIDRMWNGDMGTIETTTIKDYFKYNLNIFISKDSHQAADALVDDIEVVTVNGNPFKASTIVGTDFDDFINGGIKVDKITTGNGDDEIFALLGNDKITINGKGHKEIRIGRADGNDSILFDLDKVEVTEKINVNLNLYSMPEETKCEIAKNKQDLLIINKYAKDATSKALTQTITVKNYFGNTNKVNLTVNDEIDVYETVKDQSEDIPTATKGTVFDDELTGTEGNDKIEAFAGNDTIYYSRGNDKIYGGDGDDTYVYENFKEEREDGKYYSHTIYNSNGTDRISFTDLSSDSAFFQTQPQLQMVNPYPGFSNQYGCTYIKKGNDLIIGGFESYDAYDKKYPMNRITLKDYFKSEKGEFGVKYIDNGVGNEDYASINLADDMMIEHSWRTNSALSDHKSNKYTGTDYNDYIEGSYKQDTLKGGDGNDVLYGITSISGKDNLYGGAGNDLLSNNNAYMYGGTGNDTYTPYQQDTSSEWANVIKDDAGYDKLALPMGTYMTYFDVTLDNSDKGYSTGDMYVKDTTLRLEPDRMYRYHNTGTGEYFWDRNSDLTGENIEKVMYHGTETYHEYKDVGIVRHEVGDEELIRRLKLNDFGFTIKNGTTDENKVEHYTIGYNTSSKPDKGYATVYAETKIIETAGLVAKWLQDNNFKSVQDAIKNCKDNAKLKEMVEIFKENTFNWTETCSDSSLYEGGTAYYEGEYENNTYYLNVNNTDLYSIINDYGGVDELILDNDEAEYSFLFDVEIDEKGNLLNYSRDFYVKFAGEEANETGIVIHDGRQERHAVEQIWCGGDCLFEYNQDKIDSVRQEVAGWLVDNGYGSVQDVLHTNDETDIASMMQVFSRMYSEA